MRTKRIAIRPEHLAKLRATMESGNLESLEEIRTWIEQECGVSYTTRGVAKLLERELGARRAWVFNNSSAHHPTATPDVLDKQWPTLEGTASFLNQLSVTGDLNEDIDTFRAALAGFLPDVDRISIFIGLRNEYERHLQRLLLVVGKDVNISHAKQYKMHIEESGSRVSDFILDDLRTQGAPFSLFHPPIAIDYFNATGYYLATCIYWRNRSTPPTTETARSFIERIEPFMIHMLTMIRAKHHEDRNNTSFHTSLTRMTGLVNLTSQETRVITLRILGHSYEEIAAKLSIARSTVHKHVLAVHRKTGTSSIVELFAKYFTPQENVTGVADSLAEGRHGRTSPPSPKR